MILSLAYSPDGTVLASGSPDLTVHLWDTTTWKPFAILKGGDEVWSIRMVRIPVKWFAFSFDNQRLATAAAWAKLWDVKTGNHIATLEPESLASYITMSPNGQLLAEMGWGLRLWETSTGRLSATLLPAETPDFQYLRMAAFFPKGNTLVTGGTRQLLPSGHEVQIRLWDVIAHKEIRALDVSGNVFGWLDISPNGHMLAVTSMEKFHSATLNVWDTRTYTHLIRLRGKGRWFEQVAFSPDNTKLAIRDRSYAIHVWNVSDWTEDALLKLDQKRGHRRGVGMFAFSPDGHLITNTHQEWTSTEYNAILTIWSVETGEKLLQWTFEQYKGSIGIASRWRGTKLPLSFSPDSQRLAIGRQDGTILIIDVSQILKK